MTTATIKPIEKDNSALSELKIKIDEAVRLENKIDKLEDAAKFLASDIGFLEIRVNHLSMGEIRFADLLTSKVTHEVFSQALYNATVEYRNKLVTELNNMKF